MVTINYESPKFSIQDAQRLAFDLFGLKVAASSLPSERDQNFYLRTAGGDEYVLKIANSQEAPESLDLQNRALEHIAQRAPELALSRVQHTAAGDSIISVADPNGEKHLVRLLTYIPGELMAHVRPHTPLLLRSLGQVLAKLDRALFDFEHPAAHRKLKWDLVHARWIREYLHCIADSSRREIVQRMLARFEKDLPQIEILRQSIIYNDANDYNVLVSGSGAERSVIGVIDFGDIVHSRTLCNLAVAIAYAVLGKRDPMTAACHVTAGYNSELELSESELRLLFTLLCIRLCVTVTNSAYQREAQPQNEYLTISEAPAWEALRRLSAVHLDMAYYRLRHACGLPATPHGSELKAWLQSESCDPAPVLNLRKAQILDLGVSSPLIGNLADLQDTNAFTARIFESMRDSGASCGIGRYGEVRLFTPPDACRIVGDDGPEFRTLHMGIDVFAAPGTAVHAPLAGVVHSFADNNGRYDYGPTIILEHEFPGGSFFTLYGHLNTESLENLEAGRPIGRGERLGSIGESDENGGWPPHLHFQVIGGIAGYSGDFPGNALPSQAQFWQDLCPDPSRLLSLNAEGASLLDSQKLLQERQSRIGPSLSISYRKPLVILRGSGQYLFDETGRAYLDCVNNVAHVGHNHPRVVRAGQRQMEILNTNTRYLHPLITEYAERLCATLPDPLRVCYFVSSGSEANELAIRLARTFTGRRDLIAMEAGYHGNTSTLIDVSSYKFDGPGGKGAPDWVKTVPLADPYRGPFRNTDPNAASGYAAQVSEAAARCVSGPAAFLCEAMPGCGGQIVFPASYLPEAYKAARNAGAVCIADEVQTGFGRPGTHFWAFQTQGALPDIVTMGKPIGNGHPLAAVVTTREIADAFNNGMEYFNTFGANPVSCAIGMAVLDVIQQERLQERALDTGDYLMGKLRAMMERYSLIGDVRGSGLYIGVELVRDRKTLEPAASEASAIINRARELGVLLSTDGPLHNVLKIKPPIVFTRSDADLLADTVDTCLSELG